MLCSFHLQCHCLCPRPCRWRWWCPYALRYPKQKWDINDLEMKTRNAPRNTTRLFCIEKSTKYAYMYQGYNKPSTDRLLIVTLYTTKFNLEFCVCVYFFFLQVWKLGKTMTFRTFENGMENAFSLIIAERNEKGHQNYVKVRQHLSALHVSSSFSSVAFHPMCAIRRFYCLFFQFTFTFRFLICFFASVYGVFSIRKRRNKTQDL